MTEHFDVVHKAEHYNSHPSGIEAKHICRYLSFDLGNCFKYVIRRDMKESLRSLQSALFYWDDHVEYKMHPTCPPRQLLDTVIEFEKSDTARAFYMALREYLFNKGKTQTVRDALVALIDEYKAR
jgi:uridine kinase